MKTSHIASLFLLVLLLLLVTQTVLAMTSTTYRLDWFTPLTSNGGGASASTNYAANVTVGQTVRGPSASASYAAGLGYWYGLLDQLRHLFLPIVRR